MDILDKVLKKKVNNIHEKTDGLSLLDKHEKRIIDDKSFLFLFGKVNVFYSTPFGDHKDGGIRLFALPAPDKTAYLPVFTSSERAMEFYKEAGRLGFLVMESSFASYLETVMNMNKGNSPIKCGAIIDPGYYGITIDATALGTVIDMIAKG